MNDTNVEENRRPHSNKIKATESLFEIFIKYRQLGGDLKYNRLAV